MFLMGLQKAAPKKKPAAKKVAKKPAVKKVSVLRFQETREDRAWFQLTPYVAFLAGCWR